ncbi:MAG: phosphoglycerate dehydrogenase [Desulfovibrio sp.]|nr:phosphoglycerate dehydrogenase [Desulfovibrio sp.]
MKVLVTPRSFGKNNPELFQRLNDAGLTVERNTSGGILSREAMMEKLADCDGLILGVDPLDAEVLSAAPHLRAVAKYGVGLDNVDLDVCRSRGIAVSRTTGANSEAVADYAFTLMLTVARKALLIAQRCRQRDWSKITSIDLYGKTLGIMGLGAIGRCVARRARGFDMKILAHDVCWDAAYAAEMGIERADLDRICREADVITLHAALTPDSRHCINAARIDLMKSTAILVNTARGELVDEAALLSALREGHIYGAGLDVFEQEPPTDPAWYTLDNLVMGSHCSSSTAGATASMGHMAVDNLLRDLGILPQRQ